MSTIPDEQEVKMKVQSRAKLKDVTDVTPAVSGAVQLKSKSTFQLLDLTIIEYGSVKDTSSDTLERLHELERGSALDQNVNLMAVEHPQSTRSARGHRILACVVLCVEYMTTFSESHEQFDGS